MDYEGATATFSIPHGQGQRKFAFYDEHLQVEAVVTVPQRESRQDIPEHVSAFFRQLDIHVEASIGDPYQKNVMSPPSVYRLSQSPLTSQQGQSNVPSGGRKDAHRGPVEGVPFYAHSYSETESHAGMKIKLEDKNWICTYPFTVPIAYVRTHTAQPSLCLSGEITYRPPIYHTVNVSEDQRKVAEDDDYLTDEFSFISLFESAVTDSMLPTKIQPSTVPSQTESEGADKVASSTAPQVPLLDDSIRFRRYIQTHIQVLSALNVKMRTTSLSLMDKMLMMSVEVENEASCPCPFTVHDMEVIVANSIVTPCAERDQLPILLSASDQMIFLYNITLLEDGLAKPTIPTASSKPSGFRKRTIPERPEQPQRPKIGTEERWQPQRVSIVVKGSAVVDGLECPLMQSKWNTMLDVTPLQQRSGSSGMMDQLLDPRLSKLSKDGARSGTSTPGDSYSATASVIPIGTNSPGGRSLGSPVNPTFGLDAAKRPVLSMPAREGLFGAKRAPEVAVAEGITVSFTVHEDIEMFKRFAMELFIVNRSKHARRFMVVVPNKRKPPPMDAVVNGLGTTQSNGATADPKHIIPYMDEISFLRAYFESESHEADLICLENNVRLSYLQPLTCQTIQLKFIAVKEGLHSIDLIQLLDADTGFVTNLRNILEVYVHGE